MAGCGGGRRAGDRGGGAPRPIEASFVRESAAPRCLPLPAPPAVLLLAWRSLRSRLLRPPSLRLPRPSLSTPGLYLSDSALSLIPPAPPPPSPSLPLPLPVSPPSCRARKKPVPLLPLPLSPSAARSTLAPCACADGTLGLSRLHEHLPPHEQRQGPVCERKEGLSVWLVCVCASETPLVCSRARASDSCQAVGPTSDSYHMVVSNCVTVRLLGQRLSSIHPSPSTLSLSWLSLLSL